jgi:hypothetical protein
MRNINSNKGSLKSIPFQKMLVMVGAAILFILLDLLPVSAESNSEATGPAQQETVTGTVTDESGQPLPGVSIVVKGTTRGSITDADGRYSIEVAGEATLMFYFVGMQTQQVAVRDRSSIDITMVSEAVGLEEVVVVGYGTQKKINVTGAVDVVSNETLQNRNHGTMSQLLVGPAAGLDFGMSKNGFEPGAELDIRGIGSLTGGEPYILIDGFEGDINSLNPDDIESISIL